MFGFCHLLVDHFFRGLLTSVQHCADHVQTSGSQEPLQKCFRSLEYIFKFIIQSRLLFARATDGQYEETFRKDLFSLFKSLNTMLSKNNPHTLNTQVTKKINFWIVLLRLKRMTVYIVLILAIQISVLYGISAVFELLTQVLSTVEVTRLASSMLESLPIRDLSPQLTQAKLIAVKNMVQSKLFYEDGESALVGAQNRFGQFFLSLHWKFTPIVRFRVAEPLAGDLLQARQVTPGAQGRAETLQWNSHRDNHVSIQSEAATGRWKS